LRAALRRQNSSHPAMSPATGLCLTTDIDRTTLTAEIEALVARLHPPVALERRRDDRIAIPVLLRLTPLDIEHRPIEEQALIVVGKNISRRGLSFYHAQPISYRRALVEVAHPDFGWFAAEIDLNWCRFTRPGWYESGGRLLRAANRRNYGTSRLHEMMPLLQQQPCLSAAAVAPIGECPI
jgi:hypothetical protein